MKVERNEWRAAVNHIVTTASIYDRTMTIMLRQGLKLGQEKFQLILSKIRALSNRIVISLCQ
uniref:Uncharacterized protein n=1 Tax=Onchocerca volvulus TaxID=6282 RepID=A0A8R1XXQ9_ONCVO